jgi:cytochrome c-type biogenesis protein CcsB
MKNFFCPLLLLLSSFFLYADTPPPAKEVSFDFSILGKIPVHTHGRSKPLDSFMRETVWALLGKNSWTQYDAQGKVLKKYNAMELILAITFGTLDWKTEPLIACSYEPLLEKLSLDKTRLYCSFEELEKRPYLEKTASYIFQREKPEINPDKPLRSKLDSEIISLYGRYQTLQYLGEGYLIMAIPNRTKEEAWLPLQSLKKEKITLPYSENIIKELAHSYTELEKSWKSQNAIDFLKYSQDLSKQLKKLQPDFYPSPDLLEKEYRYNHFSPFQKALLFYILAILFYALSFKFKSLKWFSFLLLLIGFVIHSWGLWMRVVIGGRAPVSNMYESMIFFGWSAILFGIFFELIYRTGLCGLSAALCGATVQIITDNVSLDPSLPVLEPVLKSVYLTYHVLMMMVSYSAFGVSLMLAHLYLLIKIFRPQKKQLLRELDLYNYRIIQIGCVLIIFGIFLGAVWANESWGRYWAWDPKETWALITFLGYLAIIHGRYTNWWKDYGSAVGSVLAFGILMMTYYGVNFFLVGKHSYAGASADVKLPTPIFIYIIAELALLLLSWVSHQRHLRTQSAAIDLNH